MYPRFRQQERRLSPSRGAVFPTWPKAAAALAVEGRFQCIWSASLSFSRLPEITVNY